MKRLRHLLRPFVVAPALALAATLVCGLSAAPGAAQRYSVFAFNDLGMHCYDSTFAVFSILPLFNTLHAQVVQVGTVPALRDDQTTKVTYRARVDPSGSINTTSARKTNFWKFLPGLFGLTRHVDAGILGQRMPGALNARRPFLGYQAGPGWFEAHGIPITAIDDRRRRNTYPLMTVAATDKATGAALGSTPVVVPVSDEMACGNCHLTGQQAAVDPAVTWATDADPVVQYKKNILLLHDLRQGTDLFAHQPVLCASCHYSLALDLGGTGPAGSQVGVSFMSRAMHGWHATRVPQDPSPTATCFLCHPGRTTQCLRGAMSAAGLGCVDCHGQMAALARDTRAPWADEPQCQSCHTGDALSSFDGLIVRRTAYADAPDTATPIDAPNPRFAEPAGSLYRMSTGHGGLACEACHGSPHAEWPSREPNDNLVAVGKQGHAGPIAECGVCHGDAALLTLGGPHGLHAVNSQAWIGAHHTLYEADPAQCQTCHGAQGEGTVIAKAQDDRVFTVENVGQVKIYRGTKIGCGNCHENPYLGGGA
jgi:hypothetical protein